MISLTSNTTSTFTVQPDLLSTIAIDSGLTPYYLFEFVNRNSLVKYYVLPTQISANTSYRTYQLTIPASASLNNVTGGTIYLPTAQYDYNIYEQINQYNTGLTNTVSKVDVGMAIVHKYNTYNTAYTASNITNTIYLI